MSRRLFYSLVFGLVVAALTLFVSHLFGFSFLFLPIVYVGAGVTHGRS